MDKKTIELVDAIKALRAVLDSDGAYSICRADHTMVTWADVLPLGGILARIDDAIKALEETA